ncbi:MAG: RHS repeat protein [Planctomycetes bacterium]|nr:RHS repeat protein [Planctomycetota bacterium]
MTKALRAGVAPEESYVVQRTDHLGFSTFFEYDGQGNITLKTDKEGNDRNYEYTDPNWPKARTKIIEPDNDQWVYTYDSVRGNRLSTTDPLVETPTDKIMTYDYTYFGPMEQLIPSASALDGRLQFRVVTDRNGHDVKREFDVLGNLIKETVDPGGLNVVTEYLDHDSMGRPGKIVQGTGLGSVVTTYLYDALGRLTQEIVAPQGLKLKTLYSYDDSGLLATVTDPGGIVTKYEYDLRDRLIKVYEDFGGADQTLAEYFYNKRNKLTLRRDANLHETTYVYNDRSQLIKSTDAAGYETHYVPDALGQLEQVQRNPQTGAGGPQQIRALGAVWQGLLGARVDGIAVLVVSAAAAAAGAPAGKRFSDSKVFPARGAVKSY